MSQASNLKPVLGSQLRSGHPLAKGLVGCWLMNEGGGGGKPYNLLRFQLGVVNTPEWTSGIHGSALHFTAVDNDYLYTASKPSEFKSNQYMTMLVWFKLDTVAASQGLSTMGWSSSNTSNLRLLFFSSTGGLLTVSHYNAADCNSTYAISANVWYCAVAVWDGANGNKLYVNGVLRASNATAVLADTNINRCGLGIIATQTIKLPLNGKISNAYWWNCALSASKIAQLYRESFPMFDKPQMGLFGKVAIAEEILLQTVLPSQANINAPLLLSRGIKTSLPASAGLVPQLKISRGISTAAAATSNITALLKTIREIKTISSSNASLGATLTVSGIKLLAASLASTSATIAALSIPGKEKFLYEKWSQYAKRHPQKSSTGRVYCLNAYLMCRKVNMLNLKKGLPMQEEPPTS